MEIIVDTWSDHNVVWYVGKVGDTEEKNKWKVDGRSSWDALQQAIEKLICMEMNTEEWETWFNCTRLGRFMTFKGLYSSSQCTHFGKTVFMMQK